jgi:hypothetical protein
VRTQADIWPGDRRNDPTEATYSADELARVQRDVAQLARYTVEMGGTFALLDAALKVPPLGTAAPTLARRVAHDENGDDRGSAFGNRLCLGTAANAIARAAALSPSIGARHRRRRRRAPA